MNLDRHIIIDPDSGTYFGANTAILVDTTELTDHELELLQEGCDSDRGDIAIYKGCYLEQLIPDPEP